MGCRYFGFWERLTWGPTGVLQNVSAAVAGALKLGQVADVVAIVSYVRGKLNSTYPKQKINLEIEYKSNQFVYFLSKDREPLGLLD